MFRQREENRPLDFRCRRNESYNDSFSEREFDSALGCCQDTAPGPDEITYGMLRHLPINTKQFVLSLINRIWHSSNFPHIWEMATILPFSKPGKDPSIPASYRPIALTSCLCKLMEKMVNTRLIWYLEHNKILSPSQCGFRKMHSTTDVLVCLESSIYKAFASKQHHVTLFFDIEKAYDTAWRHGILRSLHSVGLRGEMPLFIKAFLSRRFFRVRVGSSLSDKRCQEEGVPQGSVLSVTLFALSMNDVTSVIPTGILCTLYVDDLSISFAASRMAIAERKIQLAINQITHWANRKGFKFSTSKTVVVHFCRIRGVHPDPDLSLYDQRIPCVSETRFLGLIFDNRLTWAPHLKNLKMKCIDAMKILKILSHTNWGADRVTLLKLYRTLILSKLNYGCEIYSSASPNMLKVLDSVHHLCIRLATGAFKSSPIPSLLVDAGEMPLTLHRKSALVRYFDRIKKLPHSLAFMNANDNTNFNYFNSHPKSPQPFGYRVKTILDELGMIDNEICSYKISTIPPWKIPVIRFCRYFKFIKRNLSEQEIRQIFLEHSSEHFNSSFIFTDGSKSNAGVGFGVVGSNFNFKGVLPISFLRLTGDSVLEASDDLFRSSV